MSFALTKAKLSGCPSPRTIFQHKQSTPFEGNQAESGGADTTIVTISYSPLP